MTKKSKNLVSICERYARRLPDQVAEIALSDFGVLTARMPERDRQLATKLRQTARMIATA